MKVLFTGLYPLYHYHFVSELNLLQRSCLAGDEVWLASCDADLMNCECNRSHELAHCLRCIGIRKHGLSLLEGTVGSLPLIQAKFAKAFPPELPKEFSSLEELKGFCLEGFDLGMSVFSSLVDRLSDTCPNIVEHKVMVRNLALDAWRVWMSAKSILAEHRFEKVYVFNGRYAAARPWVRACEHAGVDYVTHEKSGHVERILLFENQFPHDPSTYAARVKLFWSRHGNEERVLSEGREFFEERPRGQLSGWTSFVTMQQERLLPASWDPSRRNIAVFATTDGEYVGLRDLYADGLYPDQCTAFGEVAKEALRRDKRLFFYIRLHPNSRHERVRWWEGPGLRDATNIEVIPPDSPISSYAIMAASEKCVTFLSSMGIESTYWEKPSMILGKAFYSGIDAVYEPSTFDEAHDWIEGIPLCKPKINAVKFGAYMRCGGEELPYSDPVNYYTLKFKDEILEARQEVHEWLGECEKRVAVRGIKKWLQDRSDRKRFLKIIKETRGELGRSRNKV